MTDLATALADTSALGTFDGKPVVRSTIAIVGAGDGLSAALRVDPKSFHQGDKVYFVLEGIVTDVTFTPLSKDDPSGPQVRKHKIKAGTATEVDEQLVKVQLDNQRAVILKAQEAAKGIKPLPFDDEADELAAAEAKADAEPDQEGWDPTEFPSSIAEPGTGEVMEGIEVPADGSWSPPLDPDVPVVPEPVAPGSTETDPATTAEPTKPKRVRNRSRAALAAVPDA